MIRLLHADPTRIAAVANAKFDAFRIEMNSKFDGLRNDVNSRIGGLEVQIERSLKEQIRFYFLAWTVLLASNIALWFRK
jgi:hypothetical protein